MNKEELMQWLQGNGEFLYLPETVWDEALSGAIPLEEILLGLPLSQWMVMVLVLESADAPENWNRLSEKLKTIRTKDDIRYDYFDMHGANLLIRKQLQAKTLEAAEQLLVLFAESSLSVRKIG